MSPKQTEIAKVISEIRSIVLMVVQQNMADGILFSAGTDTSIIAYEAVKYKPKMPALTMAFKHGHPKDTEYVKKMVAYLHLNHQFHTFEREDVISASENIVKILKIFDPWKYETAFQSTLDCLLQK